MADKNPDGSPQSDGPTLPPTPQAQPGDANYAPAQNGVIAAIAPAINETSGGDAHTQLTTLQGAQADVDAKAKATGAALAGAAADLQSTVPKAQTVQDEGQNIYSQGQGAAQQALGLGNAMDTAEQAAGKTNAAIASAKGLAAAAQDSAMASQAVQVGMTGPSSDLALSAVNKNASQLSALTDHIADLRSGSFSDDPGSWLVNHVINIPWAESSAESVAKTLGLAKGAVSAKSEALAAYTATDAAVNSSNTTSMAALAATKAANDATVAGLTAQLQGHQQAIGAYSLSSSGAGVTDAGIGKEQSADTGGAGIANANFDDQIKAIGSGYTSALKDAAVQAAGDRSKLAAAQLEKDLMANKNTDLLQASAGAALDGLGITHDKDLTLPLKNMSPIQRQAILNLGVANASMGGAFGGSPGEIYRNVVNSKLPLDNMPPGQKIGFDEIGRVYQQAVAEVRSPGFKARNGNVPPGSEAENNIIDGMVTATLQGQQKNIVPGQGIYGTPSLNTLLSQKDMAGNLVNANNDVLQSMKPMTTDAAGGPVTRKGDFNDILSAANGLIANGKLSETKAADQIVQLAQSATQASNVAIGFKKFQIPLDDSYKVQVRTGVLGGFTSVDMKNSAQVLTALRMSRARTNAATIGSQQPAIAGGY